MEQFLSQGARNWLFLELSNFIFQRAGAGRGPTQLNHLRDIYVQVRSKFIGYPFSCLLKKRELVHFGLSFLSNVFKKTRIASRRSLCERYNWGLGTHKKYRERDEEAFIQVHQAHKSQEDPEIPRNQALGRTSSWPTPGCLWPWTCPGKSLTNPVLHAEQPLLQ